MIEQTIKQRRSIRKFKDAPVDRELINKCLEAARLAPSACNSQPWHFVVFDQKEAKDNFVKEVFTGPYASIKAIADNAPVIIAIVGTYGGSMMTRLGQLVSGTKYYLIDQGIAGEHIALQAQELGLGTCWVGWFNPKKAQKHLKLPIDKKIQILLLLGYPDEAPQPRPRKSFEEVVSYNKYK